MTDALQQPVEERYPEGEQPTTPPMQREAFDPETHWVNYWDLNPIHHGGRFVRWDESGYWDIVEATPPSAWPEPEHIIETMRVYPDDVWEDPTDPLTDFTDELKRILRQFSDHPIHPNCPPFLQDATYYACDWIAYWGGGRDEGTYDFRVEDGADDEYDRERYWDVLSGFGVDAETVESVAEESLPDSIER